MSVIHGERLILEQENGNPVSLIVSGDEFYVRHETLNGFTVVYDNRLGFYCYATLIQVYALVILKACVSGIFTAPCTIRVYEEMILAKRL